MVSVITSTIGRPELRACLESVRSQTFPVKHYVFVNGLKWHERASAILKDYPDVTAFYLPEETGAYGGVGPSMADVFAAAPFLTTADWILFLDDDNFFDLNHVESLLNFTKENRLEWAYSLRKLVDVSGNYICDDDWCSLGFWKTPGTTHLIDNSCYFVNRKLACRMSLAWTALPIVADRCFCVALMGSGARYGCTGLSTVNYRVGTGTAPADPSLYLALAARIRAEMPGGFPWRTPTVF